VLLWTQTQDWACQLEDGGRRDDLVDAEGKNFLQRHLAEALIVRGNIGRIKGGPGKRVNRQGRTGINDQTSMYVSWVGSTGVPVVGFGGVGACHLGEKWGLGKLKQSCMVV